MLDIHTVYEDDDIAVRRGGYGQGRLFVVFTGIGHATGAVPREEFVGCAEKLGGSALFISDLNRTWYNGPGVYERILSVISSVSPRSVVTVGNSMGGFGAILFPAPLKAKAAIAFVPQATVDPSLMPTETRWTEYVGRIKRFRFRHLRDHMDPAIAYHVIHGDDEMELAHHREFPDGPNVHKTILPGGHDVTATLKNQGLLFPILRDALVKDLRRDSAVVDGQRVGVA